MITITDLPEEMVQTILNCNIISFQDIVNFFSTCKHFYQMINGENIFWRRKFYKSWPDLKNICEEEEHKEYLDFKELVRARLNCRKELRPFLTKLSEKHYYCFYESLLSEDITWRMWLDEYRYRRYSKKVFVEEKELDALMHSNKVIHHLYYYLLMDELRSLYKRSQSKHRTDLTYIYYGKELLPHVRHYYLKPMWHEFMNRPIKQQILEEAATLVAQWFQPEQHMCYSYVTTELENIAQQVMERLEVVNPQHQIFSVSREQISSWTSNNIDKDQWNNSDARQILNILSEILFEKQMFQGIKTFGNTDFLRNYLCINYVLKEKCGYIVLLAIVFQAVARRLGVCCNLLSFPVLEVSTEDYWLLQWKPKCNVTNPDDEVLYIDVLHGGIILNKNNWSRICEVAQCSISSDGYCRINSLELTAYLSYCFTATGDFVDDSICHHININWENEVCWFSELLDLLKQKGIYMPMTESIIIRNPSRCIDFARDIVTTRSRSRSYEEQFAPEPKKRTPEMRFAVGMIVKNVELDLTGVIIGWLDTKPWEMYPDSPDGCYYIVLCEDLPPEFQVSLETVDKPEPINNDEIGKYFSNFNGSFYTPNEVLAKEYAEDVVYLTTHLLRQLTLNINP